MAATIAAIIGATASAAGAIGGLTRQNPKVQESDLGQQQLNLARNNMYNQALVQALVNQRAVAGSSDAFGSSMRYDPATNTWVSDLGPLPKAADTAAMQAGITRNTTDVQNQELANREALRRAAMAAPAADTAQRELQQFRPMQSGDLAGLLQQRATTAANETFRPLVSDTLRAFARTGTAAGPVLGQIGRVQADNLRKSLIDSQISAMTGVEGINAQRRQGLETTAANTANLANPNLQAGGVVSSSNNNALATALASRANAAGYTTAAGATGPNNALRGTMDATTGAIGNLPDPNFSLNQGLTGLKDIGTMFGKGGQGQDIIKGVQNWFGGSSNSGNSGDWSSLQQQANQYY
jgi:hypothetical protein